MGVVTRPRLSIARGGAFALALALTACAGPSGDHKRAVNAQIAARDFAGAEKRLAAAKESAYGKKNMVLYYLDLGAVQHDGGRYAESDASFDKAERRMDELYTKSATRAAGTLMINDNTTEYPGRRYERVALNCYRVLNYALRGELEGALVETRKLSRLLQEYADAYGPRSDAYKDDAWGHYLASLLYEDDGRRDDARIAREKARAAWERDRKPFGVAPPRLEPAGAGSGELVYIHGAGVAPRRVSKTIFVAWNRAVAALDATRHDDEKEAMQAKNAIRAGLIGKSVAVATPDLVQDPFQIVASAVEAGGARAETELVSDLAAVARRQFEEEKPAIVARAIARATVKFVLAKAATDAAEKKYGKNSWQSLLTQAGGAVASAATEVADTRGWATLPAQVRAARLRLPPGTHDLVVTYYGPSGASLGSRTLKGVVIRKGRRAYLSDRTAL